MTIAGAFDGIDGFHLGFGRHGFRSLWRCEIDAKCNDVSRFHSPELLTIRDVKDIDPDTIAVPDVFTFGSPCQDLSMAGKRGGLAGERSGLFHEAIRITAGLVRRGTRFAIWENVAGAFSSNGGDDFRAVVQAFIDIGARDVAWRVLDSQYFGVAQRRRRVFLVADFGGECAGEILALEEGLQGHPAPRREAGPTRELADTAEACALMGSLGFRRLAKLLIAKTRIVFAEVSPTLRAGGNATGGERPPGTDVDTMASLVPCVARTLCASGAGMERPAGMASEIDFCVPCVYPLLEVGARTGVSTDDPRCGIGIGGEGDPMFTLQASKQHGLAMIAQLAGRAWALVVRRLMPVECERLQGYPDDYTRYGRAVDGRVYELADGPRYKQLGNSVTVNVIEFIASRMAAAMATPTLTVVDGGLTGKPSRQRMAA